MLNKDFLLYLLVMAGVTYLVRMIPFTLVRGKIKSVYIQSFLYYIPYAVLSAMTFPYIFYSTQNIVTGLIGTIVSFVLAYRRHSLITASALSAVFAYVSGLFLG